MSPTEILWRVQSILRDNADRGRIPLGLYPQPDAVPREVRLPFRLTDLAPGAWAASPDPRERSWLARLEAQAAPMLQNRLAFLGLDDVDLGTPVNWHWEHAAGKPSPRGFAPGIDYRDFSVTGDCKLVWEPNRHHHLVVLARAYRASGREEYARKALEQVDSWIGDNPFGRGMNWRSPLELAIRVISWTWAFDLLDGVGLMSDVRRQRWMHSIYLHAWDVQRKFSQGSSANNHVIGEAAGVFIACTYFAGLPHASAWAAESRRILEEELERQTYPDGCNREQALSYHLFVLNFALCAGLVARRAGRDFSPAYWSTLERMMDFLAGVTEGGDRPAMYGDSDDGYVLDLGDRQDEARAVLGVGAVVFDRGDLRAIARTCPESVRWLLGESGPVRFDALDALTASSQLRSHAFEASGYYLLQSGRRDGQDAISVQVDGGELGYQSIAAHGHADALAVTMRVAGDDILVDPGTYDYFTYPAWRDYFRGTRAHNTVTVDGRDQSVMLGKFMWGARAIARCLSWSVTPDGGTLVAEHDGYERLPDPVRHRRTVTLSAGSLAIVDDLQAAGSHEFEIWFHLAPECTVRHAGQGMFEIQSPRVALRMQLDGGLQSEVVESLDRPGAGWVSRSYHRKLEGPAIVGRATAAGPRSFRTLFETRDPVTG